MKTQQSGFTLIELIVVIVILGILAAVAVPRFVNLSDEAAEASAAATAGAMGSAMALNYAACLLDDPAAPSGKCVAVSSCDDVGTLMQGDAPAGYSITGDFGTPAPGFGGETTCEVEHDSTGSTAEFTGIYTTR